MKIEKILLIIIKIIFILTAVVLFIFLLSQDLVWSGKIEIKTDFFKFSPRISILKPQPRIILEEGNKVIGEPIWFDVSLPRDFQKASLEITYQDDNNYLIKIGPNTGADWDYKELTDIITDGNNKIGKLDFDMTGKNINNGKLRFSLTIPNFDINKPIYIKKVKMIFERPELLSEGLWLNLVNYFNYARSQF
ncbi:hypothetical protein JW977_04525 [Candidatus Falkowbacteria bacterium]|nr:hypothetical protein [Candidatus Falkowbacteria bacterium]